MKTLASVYLHEWHEYDYIRECAQHGNTEYNIQVTHPKACFVSYKTHVSFHFIIFAVTCPTLQKWRYWAVLHWTAVMLEWSWSLPSLQGVSHLFGLQRKHRGIWSQCRGYITNPWATRQWTSQEASLGLFSHPPVGSECSITCQSLQQQTKSRTVNTSHHFEISLTNLFHTWVWVTTFTVVVIG